MEYLEMENQIARIFHLNQQAQLGQGKLGGDMELSIPASPAYWLSDDKKTGNVSFDTFTYRRYRDEKTGKYCCRPVMKKAEARFAVGTCGITMTDFSWYTIQEMEPWEYGEEEMLVPEASYPSLPEKTSAQAQEILAVRNLQNAFFEHRLHQVGELFSDEPEAELSIPCLNLKQVQGKGKIVQSLEEILAMEEKNHHCYLFLGITGLPVIEIGEDGQTAEGVFAGEIFRTHAGIGGEEQEEWKLHRQLCAIRGSYRKEKGCWKIYTMEIQGLLNLPADRYRNDLRFDKMGQTREPWKIDSDWEGKGQVETAMEMENIISRWVYSCRRGELFDFLERYFRNPENDNYMLIRSFGDKTKSLENLQEIEEKIADLNGNYRNRYYTYHAPTTPVVLVNEAGDHAKGIWYDHATTNLRSMAKSPEEIPYMVFVNKYVHEFRKMDGKWYMTRFFCEPLISQPDWKLDMVHNRGYLMVLDSPHFPDQFELGR